MVKPWSYSKSRIRRIIKHLVVLVVASVTPTLHRAQLRELLLPIPKARKVDATQIADFTDGEVTFGGNGRGGLSPFKSML